VLRSAVEYLGLGTDSGNLSHLILNAAI
jgi:hypothetical protein